MNRGYLGLKVQDKPASVSAGNSIHGGPPALLVALKWNIKTVPGKLCGSQKKGFLN